MALRFNQHALDIVPNVNLIARTVRATDGIVVWIQNTITEESEELVDLQRSGAQRRAAD
jgi:hypothetical protein